MKSLYILMTAALLFVSCSAPGTSVMSQLHEGMSKSQVRAVMQSYGLQPDNTRQRPSTGWKNHGVDAFTAGLQANKVESETGQWVQSAEVYYMAEDRGATVIDLHYDVSGRLIR